MLYWLVKCWKQNLYQYQRPALLCYINSLSTMNKLQCSDQTGRTSLEWIDSLAIAVTLILIGSVAVGRGVYDVHTHLFSCRLISLCMYANSYKPLIYDKLLTINKKTVGLTWFLPLALEVRRATVNIFRANTIMQKAKLANTGLSRLSTSMMTVSTIEDAEVCYLYYAMSLTLI